ncbi:hypothetical protein C0993_009747, partial [Termitomyces sp. T159_Od127]
MATVAKQNNSVEYPTMAAYILPLFGLDSKTCASWAYSITRAPAAMNPLHAQALT